MAARIPRETSHVTDVRAGGDGRRVRLKVIGGDLELREGVPRTREECPPHPCGYVRCKWHLWFIAAQDRPGRRWSADDKRESALRPAWVGAWPLPPTCALEVAKAVAANEPLAREISKHYDMSPSQFRLVVQSAKRKLAELADDPEQLLESLAGR